MKPTVGLFLDDARFSLAPRGGEDVMRQGLIMLACYATYEISRAVVVGREAVAMANGLFFMNLEKAMGMFWEPWVQGRVSAYPALVLLAIVATGNHFFVDAVGSVLVLLAAYVLAASLQTSDVAGTRAVTVREPATSLVWR